MGKKATEIIQTAIENGHVNLLETEAKTICLDYQMPVPEFEVAKNADEACDAAQRLGYPVVLKIVSRDIPHKTEVGGVLLNIGTSSDVEKGFCRIMENTKRFSPKARIEGILTQKMAPQGTEVIVGSLVDPQFGQTLMFGLGGIFVEILKDVTFRLAPILEQDAREMVQEIKTYQILKGYRGRPPADESAITAILLKASKLITENPRVCQMDLNPVMVYERGASIVDARMILQN